MYALAQLLGQALAGASRGTPCWHSRRRPRARPVPRCASSAPRRSRPGAGASVRRDRRGVVPGPASRRCARRTARARRPPRMHRLEGGDVALAAALGDQLPAGLQRGVQAANRRVVVGDPVEDRVREHGVDRLVELERGEIATGTPSRGRGQRLARLRHHRGRAVDGDHAAARQAVQQHARSRAPLPQPASSTVSSPRSVEPLEHSRGPLRLRGGHAVVGAARPSRAAVAPHSAVVTGPDRSRSRS